MDSEKIKQKLTMSSEDLIKMVFERPCLWDKSVSDYRNKAARDAAWSDIYREIDDEYDSLKPELKKLEGNLITRKWFNIRDAYVKSRNKDKKPYVYEKRLIFLDPFLSEKRDAERSDSEEEWTNEDESGDEKTLAKKSKVDNSKYEQNEPENIKLRLHMSSVQLIKLVRDRPCLWDKSMVMYKDKVARDAAWVEIYRNIHPDYEELAPLVKKHIGNLISKKWYNIRDAYVKARHKGSSRGDRKPYVHTRLLRFLDPFLVEKGDIEEKPPTDEETEILYNEVYIEEELPKKDKLGIKEETEVPENDLLTVLTRIIQKDEDEDTAFFKSIEPSVKALSEESKLEFRIKVLKLIRNLKFKDRRGIKMSLDMSTDSE